MVNNYQQLSKIAEGKRGQQLSTINNNCDDHEWSTIINNYPKLQKDKIGQPLSTIINNCRRTRKVNHYQQLTTIDGGQDRSTIINN